MIWYILTAVLVGLAIALTFYASGLNTSTKFNHFLMAFGIGVCVALLWPLFILAIDGILIYNIFNAKTKKDELKKSKNELLEEFVRENIEHKKEISNEQQKE